MDGWIYLASMNSNDYGVLFLVVAVAVVVIGRSSLWFVIECGNSSLFLCMGNWIFYLVKCIVTDESRIYKIIRI